MFAIAVDGLAHQLAIDRVLEIRADGLDGVVVPIVDMNGLGELGCISKLNRRFHAIAIDRQPLAALRENSAAAFLVENTGVLVVAVHVGLISADNPLLRIDNVAAVLNAAIA